MTGRELILYIMQNGLENEPVFKNGQFIGFVTPTEVAAKSHVGLATVHTWICQGRVPSVGVLEGIYIPANYTPPAVLKPHVV